MLVPLMVVGFLAVVLAAGAVLLALQNSRLKIALEEARSGWLALRDAPRQLDAALRDAGETRRELDVARGEADDLRRQLAETRGQLACVEAAEKQKEEWLDHQEKDIAWLRQEMARRPKMLRRIYKILTLGVSGTGKTALTLKWANPLVDLGTLAGTKIERYERTVSHVQDGDEMLAHVFEIRDWGGEHIVDALHELMVDEIHGLLLVVDLAARDGKTVEPARIQQQLREFQPESLKFFFGPKTMAMCKAVVLFINKSDVLSGTPAEVEREARRHYQRLIDDLERYKAQLDVRVLVGSATYGHSTHHLFAHFVGQILPEAAYDQQLLQRMRADASTETGQPQAERKVVPPRIQPAPVVGQAPMGTQAPVGTQALVRTQAPGGQALMGAHAPGGAALGGTHAPVGVPRPPSMGVARTSIPSTETTAHVARR